MKFADRRDLDVNGRKIVIRQRSLNDIIVLETVARRYKGKTAGAALLLSKKIQDATKRDNKRWWIFKPTVRSVMKSYSIQELKYISEQIDKLEGYEEKKKDKTE